MAAPACVGGQCNKNSYGSAQICVMKFYVSAVEKDAIYSRSSTPNRNPVLSITSDLVCTDAAGVCLCDK